MQTGTGCSAPSIRNELNDLIGGHASIGIVFAMLALGEARGVTGAQLIEAVLIGNEVTARVYAGYYPAIKPYTDVRCVR